MSESSREIDKNLSVNNKQVCDASYRGEYIVAIHNDSKETQVIEPGERIAQLIILPFLPAKFIEVDELNETERGAGGFGSSGSK